MSIKIASLYADIGADTSKLDRGLKSSKAQLGEFKTGLSSSILGVTSLTAAAGLSAAAVIGLGKAAYGAADATKNYRLEIGDLAAAMSMTTEEASVLYNLADDMRVQMPAVEMAFKTMARNGLQPSITGLANLSAKYKALKDPQEKVKFLTDNFGRSGLELARIMDMDRDAILDYAEALKDGLRVTGDQVEASKELYAAQDALGEQWLALRNTVFGALIPGLTGGIEATNRWMDAWGAFADPLYQDIPFLLRGVAAMRDSAQERDLEMLLAGIGTGFRDAGASARLATPDIEGLGNGIDDVDGAADAAVISLGGIGTKLGDLMGIDTTGLQIVSDLIAGIQAEEAEVGASEMGLKALGRFASEGVNPPLGITKQYLQDMAAIDLAGNVNAGTLSVEAAKTAAESLGLSWKTDVLPKLGKAKSELVEMALDRTASLTIRVRYVYGSGGKGSGKQHGGPLTGINEVGEAGTEGIINGVVIPHESWEWMKRAGMVEIERHLTAGLPPPPGGKMPAITKAFTLPMIKRERARRESSGAPAPSGDGGGGEDLGAPPQQQAVPMFELPAAPEIRSGASLPQLLSEAGRQQAEAIATGMDDLAREIRKLNETFPRAVRDAIQQVI